MTEPCFPERIGEMTNEAWTGNKVAWYCALHDHAAWTPAGVTTVFLSDSDLFKENPIEDPELVQMIRDQRGQGG